ncbi:SIMPL domain-containing protein [Orrella sp. 11846]|uniref:SIMPL domain-containing protein n=1 Tax=Orrella sp. 11846 TaxID=3409913 RepID=UPI003B5C043C
MIAKFAQVRTVGLLVAAGLLLGLNGVAQADSKKPLVELSATVQSQVDQDQVQVVLSAQVQGDSSAVVNQELTKVMQTARERLGDRKDIRISTGAIQTYPQYDKQGKISGWQGRSELVLRSKDIAATAAAADQVTDLLAISSVGFSLSDQARQVEQGRLMDSVAQAFRDKANTVARVFGYSGFNIKKLSVDEGGQMPAPRMMAMMASDAAVASEPHLNFEPGQQTVAVTVRGEIELR